MMVRPEAAKRLSDAIKLGAMYESRPDVGSSENSSGGLVRTWKGYFSLKLFHMTFSEVFLWVNQYCLRKCA